ncbi:MAG: Rieske (2Fe-2S) protein [Anaerolineae bacterium]|nr:Rieske (2Fe-2S) protein [Anaerolineae bacterium]
MTEQSVSRRDVLKLGWGLASAAILGEGLLIGLRFLAPRVGEGEFGSVITAGPTDSFIAGSVTPFNEGRFYLVRLEDGGFLALYRRCTHLGCSVPYDATRGEFVCPCHGSAFSIEGRVLNAPAPRPLDMFPVTVQDGQVFVDTGNPVERDVHEAQSVVYA